MHIVIDIPEYIYRQKDCESFSSKDTLEILMAVRNAVVLPKGHGRLIDAKLLKSAYCEDNCGARKCIDAMDRCMFINAVIDAPTVIEADKEVEQMSVILTGINADIKCIDCLGQEYSGDTWEETKEDCPMKSVDGLLIEKIQSEIVRLREYNTKLNQESDYYSTAEIQNVSGNIKGLLKAIAIIKEYCGMEEK